MLAADGRFGSALRAHRVGAPAAEAGVIRATSPRIDDQPVVGQIVGKTGQREQIFPEAKQAQDAIELGERTRNSGCCFMTHFPRIV